MCCFSRDVERVSRTRIFARLDGKTQALAYAMDLTAAEDLAMVLPLPTPAKSPEDAVRFVSLEKYPAFFEDLEEGFPEPPEARAEPSKGEPAESDAPLEVHRVGAFDASFVPSQADFVRLDERFRIGPEAWAKVPEYADWGFAVFKLRKGENQAIHPMAFRFPTRDARRLFFPTVHIHHGAWTPKADFDHALYAQFAPDAFPRGEFSSQWRESPEPANRFVKVDQAEGLVLADAHAYRREVRGLLPNADTYVALA